MANVSLHLLVAGALASTQPAPAAEPPPGEGDQARAEQLYREGADAYVLGKHDLAIEKFEQAYALSKAPALLYNIGQAYWKRYEVSAAIEDLRRARLMFDNFLKLTGAEADQETEVREHLVEIDRELAERGSPPAETAASPRGERTRRSGKPGPLGMAGWAVLAGGLVGGVTGLAVGLVSRKRLVDQRDSELDDPAYTPERDELYASSIRKANVLAFVTLGIGLAAAITGAALVGVDARRRRSATSAFEVRPHGAGLAVRF